MSIKMRMIVDSVSHEAPNMPGFSHSFGPFSKPENYPIFLSLVPTADRKESLIGRSPDTEEIYEAPREKVRIKTENEEKDAEIVRPYIGNIPRGMMFPPIPTVVI